MSSLLPSAARAAAASAAAVQVEHYKQLIAEGMDPMVALDLTAKTSEIIVSGVTSVVAAISENSGTIVDACNKAFGPGGFVESVDAKAKANVS